MIKLLKKTDGYGVLPVVFVMLLLTPAVSAKSAQKISLVVTVEKSQDISGNDRANLKIEIEKNIRKLGKYSVITNDKVDAILNEKAFAMSGLTATTETKLLKVADAFIFARVRADIDRGAVLELTLVMQDREKFVGTGKYSRSDTRDGVKDALKQIVAQMDEPEEVPDKKSRPEKKIYKEKIPARKTQMGALWRSALIPGWGQFYSERNLSGSGFLAGAILLAGAYQNSMSSWKSAKANYDNLAIIGLMPASSSDQLLGLYMISAGSEAKSKISSASNQAFAASALLAVLYLGNLADAWINVPDSYIGMVRYNFAVLPDSDFRRGHIGTSMLFGATLKF